MNLKSATQILQDSEIRHNRSATDICEAYDAIEDLWKRGKLWFKRPQSYFHVWNTTARCCSLCHFELRNRHVVGTECPVEDIPGEESDDV